MTQLALEGAHVELQGKALLKDVSFALSGGQMVGLLGPNGAGKTTAARALVGLQPLNRGQALLDGTDIAHLHPRQRAAHIAYLPQSRTMAWPISVRELVGLGRTAHASGLGKHQHQDREAIDAALSACDLLALAGRSIATLSGGERARAHLARALAAQTDILVLDEPTNALDPRHSLDILSLLQGRAKQGGAVLVVLHDLAAAARYCDTIILLDQGRCVAQGQAQDVLSAANLAQIYQIDARWDGPHLQILGPSAA
jgi:iron complex transport system ATP-binding protein